jgi:NADH-quinone oxidoreductase subunit L
LGIKEWNLDGAMHNILWAPFKWLGRQAQFLRSPIAAIVLALAGVTAFLISIYKPGFLSSAETTVSIVLLTTSFIIILFAFSYRGSALKAWLYLLLAHLFIIAGIGTIATHINTIEIVFYTAGVAAAFAIGFYCLNRIKAIDNDISLNNYHGYVYEEKSTALLFLLAAIGILGFPITTAFIGIDVLFTYVDSNEAVLISLLALCFIFIELAAIRIYLRIFLGQHKKLNHPIAFRSS